VRSRRAEGGPSWGAWSEDAERFDPATERVDRRRVAEQIRQHPHRKAILFEPSAVGVDLGHPARRGATVAAEEVEAATATTTAAAATTAATATAGTTTCGVVLPGTVSDVSAEPSLDPVAEVEGESSPENPAKTTTASTPAAARAGAHRFSGDDDDAERGRCDVAGGLGVFTNSPVR
jgi:hypothetical protein